MARPRHGEGREALLRATVHVVAREGLRGLTYRAVAEEACVANTLVAHHFGTRDALLQAALEWAAEQSIGISLLEPGTGSLEDLAAGLADLVREDAGMQAFQYELALEARRRPELLPAVERMYGAYIEATRRPTAGARGGDRRRGPSRPRRRTASAGARCRRGARRPRARDRRSARRARGA